MVGTRGFEPRYTCSKCKRKYLLSLSWSRQCLNAALPICLDSHMAPPAGLEPTLSESKSDMLPLHNGGIKTRRITLLSYPLDDTRNRSHNRIWTDNLKIKPLVAVCVYLVRVEGLEPPASCSQSRQSTTDLHPDINKTLFLNKRQRLISLFQNTCCMSLL